MNIGDIDKNLKIEESVTKDDIEWLDVRCSPFEIYGLYNPKTEKVFKRLPDEVMKSANEGVASTGLDTAGGRVRFTTDSPYVAVCAEMPSMCHMTHMALVGSSGFDMYIDSEKKSLYCASFLPPKIDNNGYSGCFDFNDTKERSLTINFPLYNHVNNLYIGIKKGSFLKEGQKYDGKKPIVYYGSSITQGGCASRPGNSYQSVISRQFSRDYINLGFSGSARGEISVAEYIASLDMSIFVCDYDYNAPNTEHLKKTHFRLYEIFREKRPETPVIFVSKPDTDFNKEDVARRFEIIEETYLKAKNINL